MKVFILDLSGCRPYDLGYQIKNAFDGLGHETKGFDYRLWKLQHVHLTNIALNKLMAIEAKKFKPGLVVVNKGETILPGTIDKIKKDTGCTAVAWNPDEPFGTLDSFNRIKNIAEYDAYFTYDEQYVKPIKEINDRTFHLPPGADPAHVHKEHIPLEKRKFPYDLCMVGTAYRNRIDLLTKFKDYKLRLAGPKWNTAPEEIASQALPPVNISRMIGLFNESKIVLNPYGASKNFICPNPRTFEIPASRSFELTDMPRETEKYFTPKKEFVVYRDEKEFSELVDYYLENDEERNKIAEAGYKRVMKEHTMAHRIRKMLEIIKKSD
jgi:spore maturation protein CgeB